MTPLRKARYFAEYAALRFGRWLIRSLPFPVVLSFANGLGALSFALMAKRRRVAVDNILQAGVAATPQAAARIARASFQHFAALMVESIVAEHRIREDNWEAFLDVSAATEFMELARAPGQGLIAVTAHFGNWEVAAQVMTYFKPLAAIARRMNNPYTNSMIQNRKTGNRFRTILRHEATGKILLDVLREGHILAMVIDQHARYRGMQIPFFGRPAATHTTAALLHLRSGAPIGLACSIRVAPLKYKFVSLPVIHRVPGTPRDEAAIATILRTINAGLESLIRQYPEQYLWAHRRWRIDQSHRLRVPKA